VGVEKLTLKKAKRGDIKMGVDREEGVLGKDGRPHRNDVRGKRQKLEEKEGRNPARRTQ